MKRLILFSLALCCYLQLNAEVRTGVKVYNMAFPSNDSSPTFEYGCGVSAFYKHSFGESRFYWEAGLDVSCCYSEHRLIGLTTECFPVELTIPADIAINVIQKEHFKAGPYAGMFAMIPFAPKKRSDRIFFSWGYLLGLNFDIYKFNLRVGYDRGIKTYAWPTYLYAEKGTIRDKGKSHGFSATISYTLPLNW